MHAMLYCGIFTIGAAAVPRSATVQLGLTVTKIEHQAPTTIQATTITIAMEQLVVNGEITIAVVIMLMLNLIEMVTTMIAMLVTAKVAMVKLVGAHVIVIVIVQQKQVLMGAAEMSATTMILRYQSHDH